MLDKFEINLIVIGKSEYSRKFAEKNLNDGAENLGYQTTSEEKKL